MGRANKVVLAYSGGVDTSVCIPYLKQEWGVEEVITFAADLGQGDELEPIRQKALDAGASQSLVGDLIQPFIEEFAFPAIRANALYEGRYPLSSECGNYSRGTGSGRDCLRRPRMVPEHDAEATRPPGRRAVHWQRLL